MSGFSCFVEILGLELKALQMKTESCQNFSLQVRPSQKTNIRKLRISTMHKCTVKSMVFYSASHKVSDDKNNVHFSTEVQ